MSKTTEATESDLTTKVFERDTDGDGKPDFRMETFLRGGRKVLVLTSKPDQKGGMIVRTRSYLVGGNSVFTEADEDGDGVFERLVAWLPQTNVVEVFVRRPDGTVRPAGTRVVELYEEQLSAMDDFFEEVFERGADLVDSEDLGELLHKAQKRIQDAEAEKRRQ
ncbi:MAG: hypothetical protein H7A46_00455 [Verrucomicrobiales bacterium]|nr:hypothetical protein [Verrucomicrobiales bacterium]